MTLARLDDLPTLAPIAVKLLQISADRDSSAHDVVDVLRGDQSLTAKILSVANSIALGAREKVATLDRAVVLLGFEAVRSIVLAVKVFECFAGHEPSGAQRHFERAEFWKHSLGVACAARRLAARRPQLGIDPEEAFVAGLLHDLGKVALDTVFPKAYERAAEQAEQAHGDLADYERHVLGIDHTVAGRHLARRWGLPDSLQEVIWLHHVSAETLTGSVAAPRLIALVQLANTFIREQRIGHSGNHAFYEPATQPAEYLGFAATDTEAMLQDVVGDLAQHVALLGLDQETPETLYLKTLARANSELGRLNSELLATNRRLTTAARYFQAITQFERELSERSDLTAVVAAAVRSSLTALQRRRLAAFGVHHRRSAVELCWVSPDPSECGNTTQRPTSEMLVWLQDPGDTLGATVTRAPPAVRALLTSLVIQLGEGECWLLPMVHDQQLAGGIILLSERDERGELADEREDLRSFLASLGLALGWANAQIAARRLSEDLAESNRRLKQTQAELLRARMLSRIAVVAAGAGHELNNPLTVISGHAQMLRDAAQNPEDRRKLQQIHEAAHEASRIVTELMEYARPTPPKLAELDLLDLLTELRDDWSRRSGFPASRFRVELTAEGLGADRPRILADRAQIRAVLDELVENAADAVAENEGTIAVCWRAGITGPVFAGRGPTSGGPRAEQDLQSWVEITVRDTGVGMSPIVAQHVFDPFFSHRPAGRGRGLGLARVDRIVESHGGRIQVESRPGEGAAFHVMLPQAGGE